MALNDQIIKQGDKIRNLKASKVPKPEVDLEVKILIALKAQYKQASGVDWQPPSAASAAPATAGQQRSCRQ